MHWSCHSFHSVPTGISEILVLSKPLLIAKLSKVAFTLATISGATLVSFHSSTGGSNSISPIQLNIKKGFKFSVLEANGCSIKLVSEYGNVIKSPVF